MVVLRRRVGLRAGRRDRRRRGGGARLPARADDARAQDGGRRAEAPSPRPEAASRRRRRARSQRRRVGRWRLEHTRVRDSVRTYGAARGPRPYDATARRAARARAARGDGPVAARAGAALRRQLGDALAGRARRDQPDAAGRGAHRRRASSCGSRSCCASTRAGSVTIVRAGERASAAARARGHRYEVLTAADPRPARSSSRVHTLAAGAVTGGAGDPPMHEPGSREIALVEAGARHARLRRAPLRAGRRRLRDLRRRPAPPLREPRAGARRACSRSSRPGLRRS